MWGDRRLAVVCRFQQQARCILVVWHGFRHAWVRNCVCLPCMALVKSGRTPLHIQQDLLGTSGFLAAWWWALAIVRGCHQVACSFACLCAKVGCLEGNRGLLSCHFIDSRSGRGMSPGLIALSGEQRSVRPLRSCCLMRYFLRTNSICSGTVSSLHFAFGRLGLKVFARGLTKGLIHVQLAAKVC